MLNIIVVSFFLECQVISITISILYIIISLIRLKYIKIKNIETFIYSEKIKDS